MPTTNRLTIANRRKGGWWRHALRIGVAGIGAGITAGVMAAVLVYTALAHDLPPLDAFDKMAGVGVTRFEAADGSLVGERYTERRLALGWEDLPRPLVLAFLAAEDARFFEHSGLDFRAIVRAMVTNLFAGGVKEGASTITQQLAKILVGSQRSWGRKVKEAILARRMEDLYSKDQILTWYINVIYFGHHSYGVQAAAQNYFRKNVWDLSLAETAMIAGCAQSPSRVNPANDLKAAKARTAEVLDNMRELGWATADEVKAAKAAEYTVHPLRDLWGEQMPDFTEAVRGLGPRWDDTGRGFLERGLTIEMAADPAAQRAAHEALDGALIDLQKKQGWPGPLGRMPSAAEREAFFAKNARWVAKKKNDKGELAVGARLLGRLAEVSEQAAKVELVEGVFGTIELATTAWATPWTTFPKKKKKDEKSDKLVTDTSGRVSFAGKLGSLSEALAVGDVVLVRVVEPPPPPKVKTTKPPKKNIPAKPKKGEPIENVAAPVEPAKVEAPPEPPKGLSLLLEPVPMMEGVILSTPLAAGGIDALATGWDFDRSEVDRTMSKRPTGSTMKPLAYALAYDLGLPPSAMIGASDFRDDTYTVHGKKELEMLAWNGLVQSDNATSARVFVHALDRLDETGWRRFAESLGLAPCEPPVHPGGEPVCRLRAHRDEKGAHPYMAEVFGADQRPRAMLDAYATFARGGVRPSLELVKKVVDREGRVLERRYTPIDPWAGAADALLALHESASFPPAPVLSPTTAYLITKNLAGVVRSGTGTKAKAVVREAGGKTGTLDYDVWFSGFTGPRAAVAWLGADDNERTLGPSKDDNKVYGSTAAASMWTAFMRAVDHLGKGDKRPGVADVVPPDVVVVAIDPLTGLLAVDPKAAIQIPHRRGTEPTESAPLPTLEMVETEF